MNYIKSVVFKKDYRCFKKGEEINFSPKINVLVGDQGSGKSSLINLIHNNDLTVLDINLLNNDKIGTMFFDFEKHNPRKNQLRDDKLLRSQIAMIFSSHGQSNLAILNAMREMKNSILFLDEPDTALSIYSCHKLVAELKKAENNNQIILSAHNPVLIEPFDVFSLEHKENMSGHAFIQKHTLKYLKEI